MVVGDKTFGVVLYVLVGGFENVESLGRWKWHFRSLLYLFGIMICESMLFVISIEIRTLDMVFKFKNFLTPPPLSLG
jgi:hypothetical protein